MASEKFLIKYRRPGKYGGLYLLAPGEGTTKHRELAHRYTREQAFDMKSMNPTEWMVIREDLRPKSKKPARKNVRLKSAAWRYAKRTSNPQLDDCITIRRRQQDFEAGALWLRIHLNRCAVYAQLSHNEKLNLNELLSQALKGDSIFAEAYREIKSRSKK